MKALLLVVTLLLMASPRDSHAQDQTLVRGSINDLAWLSGCWDSVGGEPGSGEFWTVPAGNTMFSVARTIRNGATVQHEFVQILQADDGTIQLMANPSGQEGATFQMIKLSASEVVFQNLGHDFPQRIMYQLGKNGRLDARIDGEIEGTARSIDFPLQRSECSS